MIILIILTSRSFLPSLPQLFTRYRYTTTIIQHTMPACEYCGKGIAADAVFCRHCEKMVQVLEEDLDVGNSSDIQVLSAWPVTFPKSRSSGSAGQTRKA